MVRKSLWAATLLLGLFHVWIFCRQLWSGELSDVTVLGRWLVAAGLVWALVTLRRQGASMFRGRKAIAIWVLAALLHGPALLQSASAPDSPGVPEILVTIVEATMNGAALFGLVLLLIVMAAQPRPRPIRHAYNGLVRILWLTAALLQGFAPRPPPIA